MRLSLAALTQHAPHWLGLTLMICCFAGIVVALLVGLYFKTRKR